MSTPALTISDVATELGRSTSWVYENISKLPKPILEDGKMTWSAPAFYAWMDRNTPPELKPLTAAYRALMAMAQTPAAIIQAQLTADAVEDLDRARLNARFSGSRVR